MNDGMVYLYIAWLLTFITSTNEKFQPVTVYSHYVKLDTLIPIYDVIVILSLIAPIEMEIQMPRWQKGGTIITQNVTKGIDMKISRDSSTLWLITPDALRARDWSTIRCFDEREGKLSNLPRGIIT